MCVVLVWSETTWYKQSVLMCVVSGGAILYSFVLQLPYDGTLVLKHYEFWYLCMNCVLLTATTGKLLIGYTALKRQSIVILFLQCCI
jgi:hypothetical protein